MNFSYLFKHLLQIAILIILSTNIATSEPLNARNQYNKNSIHNIYNQKEISDPLEPVNRKIFKLNHFLYTKIGSPLLNAYRKVFPQFARTGLKNFVNNVLEPFNMINSLLQGQFIYAGKSVLRFSINSTLGLFGLIDIMSMEGLELHEEDFGQTLAMYNILPDGGPFLIVPIIGPSNVRDIFGRILEIFTSSATIPLSASLAFTGARGVSLADQYLDEMISIEENSLDPYSAIKTFYNQEREQEIKVK